jgi:pyrophosphatase PpaX
LAVHLPATPRKLGLRGGRESAHPDQISSQNMIKAVLFDVDGVLIDSFDANFKFCHDLLFKAGYRNLTREMYFSMYHLTLTDVIKEATKSSSEKEIQRIWEMGNKRIIPYPLHLLTLHNGVKRTIQKLYKTYPLGIVTSRIKNAVYEFPKLAALQQYFSTMIAYEDTTNHKPHPEPLLFAVRQLKVKPSETVYIGDMESDIQAAKAAGMKVIIYSKTPFDSSDGYTSSFKELPKVIKTLHG